MRHEGSSAAQTATLADDRIHQMWEGQFEEPRNEAFYDMAFARILALTHADSTSAFLEVGCGGGRHAIRIARHGIRIDAIDLSEAALQIAGENVRKAGLDDLVRLSRQDLLALPYGDKTYSHVLCWGVLMHVPEIDRAVFELSRIVAPGGYLIVHEGNVSSPEATLILTAKRLLRRPGLRRTPAGVEHWKPTSSGVLLTRRANVHWLIRAFEDTGLILTQRLPSQLTELYAKVPWAPVRRVMYAANDIWYRRIGDMRLTVGSTLIFQRSAT